MDTGFDSSRYEALADTRNENILNMVISKELDAARTRSLNAVMFVHQDLFDEINVMINGNRSNISNGSFQLIKYKDKNAELDDTNYDGWPNSYYNLHKLSQLDSSKITWLTDAPVTSLGKYDVIIPLNQVNSLLNSKDYMYSPDIKEEGNDFNQIISNIELRGPEAKYISWNDNARFIEIQNELENVIAFVYAKSNIESAITYIKTKDKDFNENSYTMWDPETEADVINVDEIARIFSGYATQYGCSLYDEKLFYNDLISKYDLTDKVVTYEQYKERKIVFPNGETYSIFDGLSKENYNNQSYDLLFAKLALKTFESAIESAKNASEKPNWYSEHESTDKNDNTIYVVDYKNSFSNYKNEYINAVNDEKTVLLESEIEQAKNAYLEHILDSIKNAQINLAIKYEIWGNNYISEESKDAKIVGITTESGVNIVVSNDIYNTIVDEISMGDYSYVVAPMPKDRASVNEIAKFSYENTHYDGMARFALKNSVTEELNMIDNILETLGQVFLWVGVGFAVFASLMLSNFIATSISHKKQEIGILRAIGSRSNDVFMIFFAESFIISMINFVLSLIATGSIVYVLNNTFRNDMGLLITFISFGIRQIGLLLLVSLVVATIATFFPVKKIASMKPIDAIKNRK